MDPLRIGLVGCGFVSVNHLDAYARMPERATVVAVVDPDEKVRRTRAAGYGIEHHFATLDEMLDATPLDAVDIASPREHHAAGCRAVAARGLPILCQKPLAPTHAEAVALVESLPADVRLMVHENWRFRPHYRRIAAWLAEGRIGPVRDARMSVLTSGLLPDADGALPALVRQPMMAGLSRLLLMEVMIHHVDALRFLLGPLDLLASDLGHDCDAVIGEDRATLMLRARSGGAVMVMGDFMAHGHPPALTDRLKILGRDGAIDLEGDRLRLMGGPDEIEAIEIDLAADYKVSYANAIAHFLDCLAEGAAFETAPADNLETLRIVEAAYQAQPATPTRGA